MLLTALVLKILPRVDTIQHHLKTTWRSIGLQLGNKWTTLLSTWVSLGCRLSVTWESLGCQVCITWLSRGCHLGVRWASLGCHMGVTWVSHGCHVRWALHVCHVGVIWVSLRYQVDITWVSLECYLGVTWVSSLCHLGDYLVTIGAYLCPLDSIWPFLDHFVKSSCYWTKTFFNIER